MLTRDQRLDNVMLYWLPGTGASSARLYWESIRNEPDRGGHFTAFEQPQLFVDEERAFFRLVRQPT